MKLSLGLDSSTQGLKAVLIDPEKGTVIHKESVNFGADLPRYESPEGVLPNSNPLVCHADPLMWADALDLILEKMWKAGAPMDRIAAISGSGQQHGSVYLGENYENVLRNIDSSNGIAEQIKRIFSRPTSPIWMDSSTTTECREISERIGDRLQTDTGSPAIERFTGPQIRKFAKNEPDAYRETFGIHLVSSFMGSLLCGHPIPIDCGDGAGMNLLNLKTMTWDPEILDATAPGLREKLPRVVASDSVGGVLHPYYAKYGMKPGTPVVVWSGDNPCSLIGMGAAEPGTAVISLGTSDTFFAAMAHMTTDPEGYGHVFGNPAGGLMSLICFKNGSLARERIKDACGIDWKAFDEEAVKQTEPGNRGNLLLPYFVPEITPLILDATVHRTGEPDFVAGNMKFPTLVRAIFESQALSMKIHSAWIGDFAKVRVTGGASRSAGFCQVLADVFQADIEKIAVSDSAGLGAALRAAQATGQGSWEELFAKFAATSEAIRPRKELRPIYENASARYREFERSIARHA